MVYISRDIYQNGIMGALWLCIWSMGTLWFMAIWVGSALWITSIYIYIYIYMGMGSWGHWLAYVWPVHYDSWWFHLGAHCESPVIDDGMLKCILQIKKKNDYNACVQKWPVFGSDGIPHLNSTTEKAWVHCGSYAHWLEGNDSQLR